MFGLSSTGQMNFYSISGSLRGSHSIIAELGGKSSQHKCNSTLHKRTSDFSCKCSFFRTRNRTEIFEIFIYHKNISSSYSVVHLQIFFFHVYFSFEVFQLS